MALIERLGNWNDIGTEPSEGRVDVIASHLFFAAMLEVVMSEMTVTQLRALFDIRSGPDDSGRSDLQDLSALAALKPANKDDQALYIERIHGVSILARSRMAGYDTPQRVRAKLKIV